MPHFPFGKRVVLSRVIWSMAKVCYNALKKLQTFMFQSTLDIGLTEHIQKI